MALENAMGPGQYGPVLVRYYLELGRPAHVVEEVLTQDPQGWLPELVQATSRWGTDLVSRVGLSVGGHRVDREVNVRVFALYRLGDTSVIPIAWHPSVESSMLPSLEGDIELSPLGDDRAQLAISASYRPPLGWLGAVSDRALMRRVAEATIKDFLDRVAGRLEANLAQAESDSAGITAIPPPDIAVR